MEELQQMCRVCMAEAEILLDIYDAEKTHVEDRLSEALKKSQEPEPTLPDLMKECSPLSVDPDDPFPKKVCDPCLRKLRDAVYFHRRYAKSMDYIGRVKTEENDQAVVTELEMEEWDLKAVKSENEEEEEHEEHGKDDELEADEGDEEKVDDFEDEDDDEEYVPKAKKQRNIPASFKCSSCPKSFTTKAQLTKHSRDHSKAPLAKQNGTNTRPKRQSVKY